MKLIPNSYQTHNYYVDLLHQFLTGEEVKVLDKAIREILGWTDRVSSRKAHISLSTFMDGKPGWVDEAGHYLGEGVMRLLGNRMCYGCGLSVGALRSALDALNEFNILLKVGEPGPEGQCYWLQDDINQIDWTGLIERQEKKSKQNKRRVKAASQARTQVPKLAPEPAQTADPIGELLADFCQIFGAPMPESRTRVDDWCDDLEEIYRMTGMDLAKTKLLLSETSKNLPVKYTVTGPGSIIEPCRTTLINQTRANNGGKPNNDTTRNKQSRTSELAQQQLADW